MLAYAASRPVPVERRPHPNAMLAIVAAHVAVVAVVMSAKMDLPPRFRPPPTIIETIREPEPPPPNTPTHIPTRPQPGPTVTHDPTLVPPTSGPTFPLDPNPTADPGPITRPTAGPIPNPFPVLGPISSGPKLVTPPSELKPPYPASKLLTEEEAILRLKLAIDAHGRVIAVDPVGRADRVFLEAARRHLIAHWRYKPASEDGRPVASSTVITLRFQLDG